MRRARLQGAGAGQVYPPRQELSAMLAIALVSFALAPGTDLFEPPFRWKDPRGFVDLEQGRAAPSLVDLDADGVPDLVVGTGAEGNLLWYRNAGTPKVPRFVDPGWLKVPQDQLRERSIDGGPCVADIDGDGIPDVLSCIAGELLLARGLGQRTFAASVKICDRRGVAMRVPHARSLAPADWD